MSLRCGEYKCRPQSYGLRRYTILTPPSRWRGGALVARFIALHAGRGRPRYASRGGALADWSCHSECNEKSGCGRHDHATVTPREGACPTVGVSPAKVCLSTKTEILTSRPMTALQNDKARYVMLNAAKRNEASGWGRQGVSTSHIFHNQILRFTQNDRTHIAVTPREGLPDRGSLAVRNVTPRSRRRRGSLASSSAFAVQNRDSHVAICNRSSE